MSSILVLIAAPGSGAITADLIRLLESRSGSPVTVLAPDEAIELPSFNGQDDILANIVHLPIDAAVVPSANRRKRILIADMDSTMIDQECIDELGAVAGFGDKISRITERAMRGELDFEQALKERVGLLKGLDEAVIDQIIRERITLASGGNTLVATMKKAGAFTALVSGGFRQFTSRVAKLIGFDLDEANDLLIDDGRLMGIVREPILGKEAKLAALKRLAAERDVSAQDVLAVGDGANDLPMLLAAGMGVALHAKPLVQREAKIAINHGDLTALLYLQGYTESEFVTPLTEEFSS